MSVESCDLLFLLVAGGAEERFGFFARFLEQLADEVVE
jgi:hypothetical protein